MPKVSYDQVAPRIRQMLEEEKSNHMATRGEINAMLTQVFHTNDNQNSGLVTTALKNRLIEKTDRRAWYRLVEDGGDNSAMTRIIKNNIQMTVRRIEQQLGQEFTEIDLSELEQIQEKLRALRALLD